MSGLLPFLGVLGVAARCEQKHAQQNHQILSEWTGGSIDSPQQLKYEASIAPIQQ